MRPEKQSLTKEYLARLNASPFFIVVNYKGLKVAHLTELRKRLNKAGAEIHVGLPRDARASSSSCIGTALTLRE